MIIFRKSLVLPKAKNQDNESWINNPSYADHFFKLGNSFYE